MLSSYMKLWHRNGRRQRSGKKKKRKKEVEEKPCSSSERHQQRHKQRCWTNVPQNRSELYRWFSRKHHKIQNQLARLARSLMLSLPPSHTHTGTPESEAKASTAFCLLKKGISEQTWELSNLASFSAESQRPQTTRWLQSVSHTDPTSCFVTGKSIERTRPVAHS